MTIKAVLFDADGVLLDSLGPHLNFCKKLSDKYLLGLDIPDENAFKKMARNGTKISPMPDFFRAVKFCEDRISDANDEYVAKFLDLDCPPLFCGIGQCLKSFYQNGLPMGIVTSNVRQNIAKPLGEYELLFRQDCIFSEDNLNGAPKSEGIARAVRNLNLSPAETLYVGDQPSDRRAAEQAGVDFLGVAYGWVISQEDNKDYPVVKDVHSLCSRIAEMSELSSPPLAAAKR